MFEYILVGKYNSTSPFAYCGLLAKKVISSKILVSLTVVTPSNLHIFLLPSFFFPQIQLDMRINVLGFSGSSLSLALFVPLFYFDYYISSSS